MHVAMQRRGLLPRVFTLTCYQAVLFCYKYLKDYSLLRFPQTGALSCADFPQLHVLKRGPGYGAATDRPTTWSYSLCLMALVACS